MGKKKFPHYLIEFKSGKILHELMDVLFLLIHKYSNILCLCVGVWINYSKNETLVCRLKL